MKGRRPTSVDVAKRAGVAQSTVSYVLSGRRPVSPEVTKRVLDVIDELGFQPHAGARALRSSRTHVIGLCIEVGTTSNSVETARYIDAVVNQAQANDYDVVITTATSGPDGVARLAHRSVCDGFIITGVVRDDARIHTALDLGVPVVAMGRMTDGTSVPTVDVDTRSAATDMVHTIAPGHDRIIVLSDDGDKRERFFYLEEFYSGLTEAGADVGARLEIRDVSRMRITDYVPLVREACGSGERCGFLVRTPAVTATLVEAAALAGFTPGRDLSILSHCANHVAAELLTPVSTISARPQTISRTAVDLIIDRIVSPEAEPRTMLIPPKPMVDRGSLMPA